MITHVAIKFEGKIWSLSRPNRHHHIVHQIYVETGVEPDNGVQGFLDHDGAFLDRKQALIHATECDQLLAGRSVWAEELCSENLW